MQQAAEEQRQLEAILASSLNEIEMAQLAQRKEEVRMSLYTRAHARMNTCTTTHKHTHPH